LLFERANMARQSAQSEACAVQKQTVVCACVIANLTGLWAQGECAERCAEAHGFSRETQEDAALEGFRRATAAAESGATAQVEISCATFCAVLLAASA